MLQVDQWIAVRELCEIEQLIDLRNGRPRAFLSTADFAPLTSEVFSVGN